MYIDSRGGYNRKRINTNFFKTWSPSMAYVLGLVFADGAIEDVRKSSRTCYLQLLSIDKGLIDQVQRVLSSKHKIYIRKPILQNFFGKKYHCRQRYLLRIGSKEIFQDLVNLGVTPRKSLKMKFPAIPSTYINYFVRGYFDGDGCVYTQKEKGKSTKLQVIFTSGSKRFLVDLSNTFVSLIDTSSKTISKGGRAFRLRYTKRDGLKVLLFMYKNLDEAPYLQRKYEKYMSAIYENTFPASTHFSTSIYYPIT